MRFTSFFGKLFAMSAGEGRTLVLLMLKSGTGSFGAGPEEQLGPSERLATSSSESVEPIPGGIAHNYKYYNYSQALK